MTGDKTDINFLSAGDRNNYGDFLFSIIAKNVLSDKIFSFRNYGLVKSNFEYYGALPTKSYKSLQNDLRNNDGNQILLIGGGEVFFVSWTDLYRFISRPFNKLMNYQKFRTIEHNFQLSKKILSAGKISYAYTPGPNDFHRKNIKIVYNGVGGIFRDYLNSNSRKILVNNLLQASFVSVRDKGTKISLKKEGVNSKLVPDSALIMSDFFNLDYLKNASPSLNSICEEDYLFFQIAKAYRPKDLKALVKKLKDFGDILKLKVVLCPIGLAQGHEDQLILKELKLAENQFIYIEPKNLYEIMGLIACSKLYIGTSLHGAITAQSFEIPFIKYNNIRKVDSFFKTWHSNLKNVCFSKNSIEEMVEVITNWDYEGQKMNTDKQKIIVYKNFEAISKLA